MRQAILVMTILCVVGMGYDYSPKPDHDGNIGSPAITPGTNGSTMTPTDAPAGGNSQPTTTPAPTTPTAK